ncbi:MAG: carbohydrate kinase family protein [Candidatus Thorarchaeota archaeon]
MNKLDILGLGEVVIDWVVEIPNYPKPDDKIDALSENYFPGGVTANYLVAISRLGGFCGFIGAVGDDFYGDVLINDFKTEKIDTSLVVKKKNNSTPINYIMVVKGEKSIIQSPHMQTTKINISDLDESYIGSTKVLHTTAIHQKVTEKAIEIAKKFDVKISIDLESQIAQRGWKVLKNILLNADILFPNKNGAKTITNTNSPEVAAEVLVKKGIPIVIITLGKEGVLITTKRFQKKIPAYHIENVIDTTGAGDCFNGAYSYAYWIKGWDLERSCKYATVAAALKIQKLGARTGMPSQSEILQFIKKNDIKWN